MSKRLPLGIRLNNPGNIEISNDQWQGLAPRNKWHERFFAFASAVHGIRAIARLLITYQDKRKALDGSKIDTVREIIERWAPPEENNTSSYVRHVRQVLGLNSAEYPGEVDVHKWEDVRELVIGIIKHENAGYRYPDAVIDKGLVMAGIEPPKKSLATTRTVKGGALAGAALLIDQASPALPLLQSVAEYAPAVLQTLVLAGIAWMLYARWDDRRRGLR